MAIDLRRPLNAAIEAALNEAISAQREQAKKPRLTAGRALLLGAGVVTAGRLAVSPRGREILAAVQQGDPSRIFSRDDGSDPEAEGEDLEDEDLEDEDLDDEQEAPDAKSEADEDIEESSEQEPEAEEEEGPEAQEDEEPQDQSADNGDDAEAEPKKAPRKSRGRAPARSPR